VRLRLRVRAFREDFRNSLFFLPALCVLGAIVLWRVMAAADSAVEQVPSWLRFDALDPTALLAAIAGATITVAGLVFSLTAVTVQLASSQFSPRVLRRFRRDRFQQVVLGLVVGTFTYALLAITTVGEGDGHLTVAVAVVLAVASALAILASIDHTVGSLRVGEVIAHITAETIDAVQRSMPPMGEQWPAPQAWSPPTGPPDAVVGAPAFGWIQLVSVGTIIEALPPGVCARLEVPIGGFVADGAPLVSVWGGPVEPAAVVAAFDIGSGRTMQEDPGFGIRQLADIGLRALSPAINDPTTAFEVVVHLATILRSMLQRDVPAPVRAGAGGQVVWRPHERTIDEHVDAAFRQLRLAGREHPDVLLVIIGALQVLDASAPPERRAVLREQAALVVQEAEASKALPRDVARVRKAAEPLGPTGSAS
jgi:uncharacterized membrane protein